MAVGLLVSSGMSTRIGPSVKINNLLVVHKLFGGAGYRERRFGEIGFNLV